MPGSYFNRLVNHYTTAASANRSSRLLGGNEEDTVSYEKFVELLIDPNTKRFLFDARQAKIFDDTVDEIPQNIVGKINPPFEQFYLEFTEPVKLGISEPGYENDIARAILFRSNTGMQAHFNLQGQDVKVDLDILTIFLSGMTESGIPQYVDNTFFVSREMGCALARVELCKSGIDPSEIPENWQNNGYVPCNRLIAGYPNRHIGWWERMCDNYGTLFLWMMAYTMAKSIKIVEEPLTRQQRRWFERHNKLPEKWHIVKVEPKFYNYSSSDEEAQSKYTHTYRYDVIGHLRFGKHKRKDGSYSETIEWVPPHQRGLANSLYIPKTYKVESGKEISHRMKDYFR